MQDILDKHCGYLHSRLKIADDKATVECNLPALFRGKRAVASFGSSRVAGETIE
jgi:hypothetical protein